MAKLEAEGQKEAMRKAIASEDGVEKDIQEICRRYNQHNPAKN